MKDPALTAAQLLVFAVKKAWAFSMFEAQLHQMTGKKCADFEFLPNSPYWNGRVLVRAYVKNNWPVLMSHIDTASPEKLITLAKEVVKLKWNGMRPQGSITSAERGEVVKTRNEFRASVTSYRLSRDAFQAGKRNNTDWNTCK